jgi:organic radical activating enzyme
MTKKFFPINTATACQNKWTWSTITLHTAVTNSCHRVQPSELTEDNFNQFHNTEKKLSDRKLMLAGEWPKGGCEYCADIERAGGKSDRQFHSSIPNLYPPELDQDPTAINVTPRIVEVYFNNLCNMSCIYCTDIYSSRIHNENLKFGEFHQGGVLLTNFSNDPDKSSRLTELFWIWISENYHHIKRLQVLGGEPFYLEQFTRCLDFLESRENPDLEFNVVTNLNLPLEKLKKYIARIKKIVQSRKIKKFDITCSIDCWGPEQEYVRYGLNLEKWKINFEYLVEQKWITLNINQTITGLTIKSMQQLIEFLNIHRKSRKIQQYLLTVGKVPYLDPGIFGPGFFDDDFKKILSIMPRETQDQENSYQTLAGVHLEYNNNSRDVEKIQDLKIFLTETDRRRGCDWKKTFPWLEEVFNSIET